MFSSCKVLNKEKKMLRKLMFMFQLVMKNI